MPRMRQTLAAAALFGAVAISAPAQQAEPQQEDGLLIVPFEEPAGEPVPGAEEMIELPEGMLEVPEAGALSPEEAARFEEGSRARLRGLDTLTNAVSDFVVTVGDTVRFERLVITLEACRYPAQNPEADAYAYLRIRDEREEEDRFSGWMLASSPALSALDHPRYDVWVLSCSTS